MIKSLIKNILLFIFLVLTQVLIFNNIELGGFLNPYVYVLFILLLPFDIPGWFLLLVGFGLGLTVDIFSETLGMHTAATVLMAYLRPAVLRTFSPREGYEAGSLPRVHYYGLQWFIQYTVVLVFAHHAMLFLTEMFRFQDIFAILLRIILSTLFSASIIVLSQFIVFKK
jgi:rod shape-determining protein MreD